MKVGKVYIIGAGPGDPGLITIRGMECLKRADVIVYDYLVGRDILGHARKDARMIYVGKKGGNHSVSQDNLNRILVEEASEGNIVARLKGAIHSSLEEEEKRPLFFPRPIYHLR
jgi:Uroporphyrinogen-III methylase